MADRFSNSSFACQMKSILFDWNWNVQFVIYFKIKTYRKSKHFMHSKNVGRNAVVFSYNDLLTLYYQSNAQNILKIHKCYNNDVIIFNVQL